MIETVYNQIKKRESLNSGKKESFQIVPKTANGEFRSSRSEFQTAFEAWKKPRGPIVLVLVLGTMRRRSWNQAECREERVDDTAAGTK